MRHCYNLLLQSIKHTTLEELDLTGCATLGRFERPTQTGNFYELPSLKQLRMNLCVNVNDAFLEQFLSGCPNLELLEVNHASSIISPKLQNVKQIQFLRMQKVSLAATSL
jgi:hypothetical protein